ncbi:hypothetical protein EHQ05_00760 [Leptospira yasudae]|uniref:hypothetical protein n=1 Tax=Leptospira yasudae TaxID=2202201 RepID=UPI0010836ED7|nr:hypothetical protein [Leptospira yasudae]TGK31383.1 hypothetical protein EHQ05_00760 [Leptospira yasudae]TGM06353.1 hypothetical protein EHQ86_08865 [Leptospira yasudae]
MRVRLILLYFLTFHLFCGSVRDAKAYDFDISYTYDADKIIFHIQNKLGRKIPWRHINSLGVYSIKENGDHETFLYMTNVGCIDANVELKYGIIPEGFLVKERKSLNVGNKYIFYFIPIILGREFRLEFTYDPPKENKSN